MRFALSVVLCLAISPGWACDRELLTVESWSARQSERGVTGFVELDVAYQFNGDRPVRMIDGRIAFYDVLDELIGSVLIERDQTLAPGSTAQETQLLTSRASRLVVMAHEDVVTNTCVEAVVYDDGTVERFDR